MFIVETKRIIAAVSGVVMALAVVVGAARADDVGDRVRKLEQEIEALKTEIRKLESTPPATGTAPTAPVAVPSPAALLEVERRLDILAAEVERLKLGEAAAPTADRSSAALGPAASKVYRASRGVSIGGYGEAVYESFAGRREDGQPSELEDQVDLRRAVLYFGYRFDSDFLFNSELEVEHAVAASDKDGEVEIEFAYVDRLFRPSANLRAGLLLLPVGLINELHEPTVFLGVDRPLTEELVIPTTWREIGLGVYGESHGFTYRSFLTNSLDGSRFSAADGLAEGKGEGSQARAKDLAWSGRLDFTGVPGLLVGGSLFAGRTGQGLRTPEGGPVGARTVLGELHADWRWRGLQLRGLAARATIADAAALSRALRLEGAAAIGSRLQGRYLEAGFNLFSLKPRGEQALIPFARLERVDTQDEVPSGFLRDPQNDRRRLTLGMSYKPIDALVFKADWRRERNASRTGVDRVALSMGYVF